MISNMIALNVKTKPVLNYQFVSLLKNIAKRKLFGLLIDLIELRRAFLVVNYANNPKNADC